MYIGTTKDVAVLRCAGQHCLLRWPPIIAERRTIARNSVEPPRHHPFRALNVGIRPQTYPTDLSLLPSYPPCMSEQCQCEYGFWLGPEWMLETMILPSRLLAPEMQSYQVFPPSLFDSLLWERIKEFGQHTAVLVVLEPERHRPLRRAIRGVCAR